MSKMKYRARNHRAQVIIIACMLVVGIVFVLPYVWMILDSFKPLKEISQGKTFFPKNFTTKNYVTVVTKAPLFNWLINSCIVSFAGTFIVLFTSTLAGFVFAKYNFRGRDLIFLGCLILRHLLLRQDLRNGRRLFGIVLLYL